VRKRGSSTRLTLFPRMLPTAHIVPQEGNDDQMIGAGMSDDAHR
jgi:hypothetical protein